MGSLLHCLFRHISCVWLALSTHIFAPLMRLFFFFSLFWVIISSFTLSNLSLINISFWLVCIFKRRWVEPRICRLGCYYLCRGDVGDSSDWHFLSILLAIRNRAAVDYIASLEFGEDVSWWGLNLSLWFSPYSCIVREARMTVRSALHSGEVCSFLGDLAWGTHQIFHSATPQFKAQALVMVSCIPPVFQSALETISSLHMTMLGGTELRKLVSGFSDLCSLTAWRQSMIELHVCCVLLEGAGGCQWE